MSEKLKPSKQYHSPDMDLSTFIQMPVSAQLARILPIPLFRAYIYSLGMIYYTLHPDKRAAMSNALDQFFVDNGRNGQRLKNPGIRSYQGVLDHYYEKLVNAYRPLDEILNYLDANVSIENPVWADEIKTGTRGALFISGHFGAVEYLPLFFTIRGFKPSIIMRSKTHGLHRILTEKSKYVDLQLIDASGKNVILKAIKAINRGRTLITLGDEFKHWLPTPGKTIELFGDIVPRDRTLNLLYRLTKAPTYFGLMRREKRKFHLHLSKVGDGVQKVDVSYRSWKILKKYIGRYPDQWYQWQEVATGLADYKLKMKE
ncbi:MAG: hypothetical protein HKM93_00890 [Desulfobacteraceae bacterium]|nr:hypothetical protein [Desulfobacteraceae bacterium]